MAGLPDRVARRLRTALLAVVGTGSALASSIAHASPPEADPCAPGPCASLTGRARSAGERQPLDGASVLIIAAPPDAKPNNQSVTLTDAVPDDPPWTRVTVTDDDGRFAMDDVPVGLVRVMVLAPGFVGTERIVDVSGEANATVQLFAQPAADNPYRTVVSPRRPVSASPRRHVLERKELQTMPGTQGDPLRALQNLPGVARAPASLGLLVLRGAPPQQSGIFFGGHALPRAFHILSLASVFPAEVIDHIDFVPGNFDPAYGNATGGVVLLEPRAGRRDGVHGHAEIDLAAASVLAEGPVGDGSFVVAAQRGYVDAVVAGAAAVIERVTDEPSGLLLPGYWDYQGMVDQPLPGGATFSLRVLGAGDRLRGQGPANGTQASSDFEFRSDFHRADLVFAKKGRRVDFLLTPSFRYELGRIAFSTASQTRRRDDAFLSLRAQGTAKIAPHFNLTLGADGEIDRFITNEGSLVVDPITQAQSHRNERGQGVTTTLGTFVVTELHGDRWSLRPGLRANAFSVRRRTAYSLDPRMSARVGIGERFTLTAGLGNYSQLRSVNRGDSVDLIDQTNQIGGGNAFLPPVFSRFDPSIEGAPQDVGLTVRQAVQASLGGEVDLAHGISLSLTGYVRDQNNAEPTDRDANEFGVLTRSRSIGAEVLLRKRMTKKLYGWVAYTLSSSDLRVVQGPPSIANLRRRSDFDQRHNLILLASYDVGRGWRIGGRFRVVTGYPFSPIIGSLAVRGGYIPIQGEINAARLPPFHQLDLRVDRSWILRRVSLHAYMDVQNVYNRQNPEAIVYTPDFRSEAGFVGIPIYPTLGVRLDY